jgi:hypothetical protein
VASYLVASMVGTSQMKSVRKAALLRPAKRERELRR